MAQLYYRKTDGSSYRDRIPLRIVRAESELSAMERAYLGAIEKGDYASVKQALEEAEIYFRININCVDPLGRTALLIAIENENLEIIELLLSYNVYVGDALLHAIRKEVVGAVELLLNHKKPRGEKQVLFIIYNNTQCAVIAGKATQVLLLHFVYSTFRNLYNKIHSYALCSHLAVYYIICSQSFQEQFSVNLKNRASDKE